MENETRFLSFSEFKERHNIKTNFLSFCGVISAIKHLVIIFKKNASHENTNYESFLDKFLKAKNPNRAAYKKLVEKKQKQPVNSQTKWSVDCMIEENETIDWKTTYKLPFQCTKISKLLVFQFKLLHRRLATNNFFKKNKSKRQRHLQLLPTRRGNSYPSFLELYGNFLLLGIILSNGCSIMKLLYVRLS